MMSIYIFIKRIVILCSFNYLCDVIPASQIQLISTETLQKLLSCCYRTAVEVGSRAGARIQIGKAVRWKVSRINDYLESICGGSDDE